MLKVNFSGIKNLLNVFLVAFLLIGCSSKTFVGQTQWAQGDIEVDGDIQDWPQLSPLYYDKDNRMSVQMINNDEALYIYLSVAGKDLKKGVAKDGLTLTFEPIGMPISPLKIIVKGHNYINVFCPSESDPVLTSIAEERERGIEVKMGQPDGSAMVFEAKIGLDSFYPTAAMLPGTKMTLKIESKKMESFEKSSSEKSRGGPGGGEGQWQRGWGQRHEIPGKKRKSDGAI